MGSPIYIAWMSLVAFLAAGCGEHHSAQPGRPAPDFSGTSIDGQPVSLVRLGGKVVVLDFWASWCPPCRQGLPHLQAMSVDPDLLKSGLAVIAVDEAEDDDTIQEFLNRNHYTFPTLPDRDGALGRVFDVSVLPTTIVIDRDGVVRAAVSGYTPQTEGQIKNAVTAACSKPPG